MASRALDLSGPVLRIAATLSSIDVSRPLVWLRWVGLCTSLAVVLVVHYGLAIPLPLAPLLITVAVYSGWSAAIHLWQVRVGNPGPRLLTVLLKGDVLALTVLLYFTGGWTNPVVSLYLLPVAVSAAVLPWRHALAVALTCAAAYSWLTVWHVPLPSVHERFGGDFNLHIAGMWVNFLVANLLVAIFVATLAQRVRITDRALMQARERQLRDEHIVSLGTLAAGAAHELSTPLSTLRMLVDELAENRGGGTGDAASVELMRQQIELMRDRLRLLRTHTAQARGESATRVPLRAFLCETLDRWRASRPDVVVELTWGEGFQDISVIVEATVAQAITSIVDNAADASQAAGVNRIGVSCECDGDMMSVDVRDFGPGIADEVGAGLGRRFATTKAQGHGIGLVLSHASLERLGGRICHGPVGAAGTRSRLELPLRGLMPVVPVGEAKELLQG